MKSLKQSIRDDDLIVGSWLNSASPVVAELMAQSGFDYLCVDAEHSPVDLPQVQQLFQAIRSGNSACHALVRLHGVDYSLTKRYLDAGADGIVAPLVRSREDIETLIRAVRYPPRGMRGVGFCRANEYGCALSEHFQNANEDVALIIQIEHIDAANRIDDLLAFDEVDAVFIGPYDLSASMGLTAQFNHPEYLKRIDQILSACKRHGKAAGIHVVTPEPEQVEQRVLEGYRFIAYSLDITLLTSECRRGLKSIEKLYRLKQ
jgi:2-dehydro-3-deoxyglucarate aldolase